MAIWTEPSTENEEGWRRLRDVLDYLRADRSIREGRATLVTKGDEIGSGASLLLALEDARVLNRRLERVEELHRLGFRILTPLWGGETCIGGSHDTDKGLTDFGRHAIRDAVSLGMIADISHASLRSADEILEIASREGRPAIASHSNAYDICPASRNLRRDQIRDLLALSGIIGLNLHRPFLSNQKSATREDVLRHMEYFLEQGCEDALCFGCDMDGATMPTDLPDLSAIPSLREYLSNYYSDALLDKLFFRNAHQFATRYLT
jgi:membrane dipeptidase